MLRVQTQNGRLQNGDWKSGSGEGGFEPLFEESLCSRVLLLEKNMSIQVQYEFLESRPRSNYKQLWVKGRHIRAEVLYRYTVGPEPEFPEQVAKEYDLPVGAVLEAIDYCTRNRALLDAERSHEAADVRARGLDRYPHIPSDYSPPE